jgi:hypothetical protein
MKFANLGAMSDFDVFSSTDPHILIFLGFVQGVDLRPRTLRLFVRLDEQVAKILAFEVI